MYSNINMIITFEYILIEKNIRIKNRVILHIAQVCFIKILMNYLVKINFITV